MESRRRARQGAALVAVIVTALIASVAAFGALLLAMSHAQSGGLQVKRLRAQYAAEAGLVWAQQQLWADPAYCGTPDPPAINGLNVDVIVSPSPCVAGTAHRIQAKVTY